MLAASREDARFIGAVVSSSLFFFWFFCSGNCRNLTFEDIRDFPIGLPDVATKSEGGRLFSELMDDLKTNSFTNTRGQTAFQEFDWGRSKGIVDEIDQLLAQHYGLTEQELCFITNYDVKIRMGGED